MDSRAHKAVYDAVKRGDLPPVKSCTCQSCGNPASDYHHDSGYEPEHWLTVTPLCKTCHMKIAKSPRATPKMEKSVRFVLDDELRLLLIRVAQSHRDSMSVTIRRLILQEAKRLGITA